MASLGFNVDPSECAANGRSTRENTTSGICPNDGEPALARAPRAPRASKPRSSSRGTFAIVPDLSPRTCANEEAGAVVFSLVDDDATDDLPDKQGDLARGFTRANAFYVGNEALEKLDVVSAKMCLERSKRDGEVTCVKSCVDIVDSDFAYAGQTPPFGSATKKAIWAMTGQVDHPPNGAFHVAAPGAWSCSETAPAIARGEDGTASASANWFVAGEGVALRRGGSTDELFYPSGACAGAGAIEWDSFYVVVNATNPPGFLPRRFGFGDHLCARDGTTCAPPSPAPPPPPWARLSTSYQSACALLDGGVIKCWGSNEYGQLGLGDTSNRGDASADQMGDNLPVVDLGTGRTAKMIGGRNFHACAVLDDDSVKCWGQNYNGQLGLGHSSNRGDASADQMGDNLPVVDLGPGRTAKMIGVGNSHTCAVLDDGSVKCWGYNGNGQLGLGDSSNRGQHADQMGDDLDAVDLGPGRTAKMISAGGYHTCAVLDDDSVKCWGYNNRGQLGLCDGSNRGDGPGEMGVNLDAVDLGTGRTAKMIAGGAFQTCAVLDNDKVKCWGSNGNGQLGLGHTSDRGDGPGEMGDALPAVDLGSGRTAKMISAGIIHTCAVLDDDSVKCWGSNEYGQLGLGHTSNRGDGYGEMGDALPAVDLGPGRTAKMISAGHRHTCAVLDDDSVKCWGRNDYGQLGLGDTSNRGDGPGEMGDALPVVDLGTYVGKYGRDLRVIS